MEPSPTSDIPEYAYDGSESSHTMSGSAWPTIDGQADVCQRLIAVCPQSEPIPLPPLEIPHGMIRIYICHFDKIPVKHRGCWTCHDVFPEQPVVELFMGHFHLGGVEPFAPPPAQPNPRLATALHQVGELRIVDGIEEFSQFPPGKRCCAIFYDKESSMTIEEAGWLTTSGRVWLTLTMGIRELVLYPASETGSAATAV